MKVLCRGTCFGYVYNHMPNNKQILNGTIEQEKKKFLKAIEKCSFGYGLIEKKVNGAIRENINDLRLFITNPQLVEDVLENVSKYQQTAAKAFDKTTKIMIKQIKDNHERLKLIEAKENIMCLLSENIIELPEDRPLVLVVDQLYPKDLTSLKENIKGIVISNSELFLPTEQLLKELNIPIAVIPGLKMSDDEYVKMDLYTKIITKIHSKKKEVLVESLKQVKKNEDFAIYLDLFDWNNLSDNYTDSVDGVGLFKTENLLYNGQIYPSKGKQISTYKKVLSHFYPKPVYIKLFDFTKQTTAPFLKENAVDCFCFYDNMHKLYIEQIEALLIANQTFGNLKIVIPMIRENYDYCHVKKSLEDFMIATGNKKTPSLGVMIETMKAFENINDYKNVDFVIVGTDNLTKELFGLEENNLEIEFLLEPIKVISKFCKRHKIDYFLSGNMIQEEKNFTRLVKSKEKSFILSSHIMQKALQIIS